MTALPTLLDTRDKLDAERRKLLPLAVLIGQSPDLASVDAAGLGMLLAGICAELDAIADALGGIAAACNEAEARR
jgi:hypothetical protein